MSRASQITLRPAAPSDRDFLLQVYAESRATELSATDWSDADKAAFCESQFQAQDHHYREYYPQCEYLIIEETGSAVGRLYRDRRADEIRIVDIALCEAARGRGVGGEIMRRVLAEAAEANLLVRIHVERTNPARNLYDRLGFKMVEEGEVYDLLAWCGPLNQ